MAILGKNIDPNKKHYFSSIEVTDLSFMADTAMKEKLPIKVWAQGKDKEAEEYEPASFDDKTKTLFLKSKSGGLMSFLTSSKLVDKEVFIKIGKEKFQWFSVTVLKYNKETKLYHVTFNNEVYRSQQRSNYRLPASSSIVIQFKIGEDVYDGLDISAGGLSFPVPEADKDKFPKDARFEGCTLLFNRKKFEIPVSRIAGQWEHKMRANDQKFVKIGIAFEKLSNTQEEELFKHINSEARAEEMRKQLAERAAKGKSKS
ncbi:MAG: hypothetical protein Fur0010_12480 [Bdellovibrio sp.]